MTVQSRIAAPSPTGRTPGHPCPVGVAPILGCCAEGNAMEIFKNSSGYAPLLVNLEGYWDKPLAQLPNELRPLVEDAFFCFPWDSLNVENRKRGAAQKDYGNDSSREPVLYFELFNFAGELKGWIEKARRESKDAAVVVLRDVADRIDKILQTDRERVGAKIKTLHATHADRHDAGTPTNRSEKLTKLNQASTKFWSNADRDDRATHPNNAKVVEWLVERKFSETLAEKAATIIRPDWAPTGRKPEE